jgi:hypothetical protein
MDLRFIVLYLRLKGMNGREIDDDLDTTLHNDALAYSTMNLWLRQERLHWLSESRHDLAGYTQARVTNHVILFALTIQPFSHSAIQISA